MYNGGEFRSYGRCIIISMTRKCVEMVRIDHIDVVDNCRHFTGTRLFHESKVKLLYSGKYLRGSEEDGKRCKQWVKPRFLI